MAIPLAFAESGKDYIVVDVKGCARKHTMLVEKGFYTGAEVCLVKSMHRNYVIKVGKSQYVIGFGYAKDIIVEYKITAE